MLSRTRPQEGKGMSTIKLSKDAAIKARKICEETYRDVVANTNALQKEIELQYMNLNDKATTRKLAEMFSQLENLLRQLRDNFNDAEEFCDKTIRWIDEYTAK